MNMLYVNFYESMDAITAVDLKEWQKCVRKLGQSIFFRYSKCRV